MSHLDFSKSCISVIVEIWLALAFPEIFREAEDKGRIYVHFDVHSKGVFMLSEVHLNKHKTEIRWKKTLNLNTKQVLDITFSRLITFKIFLSVVIMRNTKQSF